MNITTPQPLRIAGVPEAFNNVFDEANYPAHGVHPNPTFVTHGGGSGAKLTALTTGEVDAAFMLTDCIAAAIENGQPIRCASPLVLAPLVHAVQSLKGTSVFTYRPSIRPTAASSLTTTVTEGAEGALLGFSPYFTLSAHCLNIRHNLIHVSVGLHKPHVLIERRSSRTANGIRDVQVREPLQQLLSHEVHHQMYNSGLLFSTPVQRPPLVGYLRSASEYLLLRLKLKAQTALTN